EQIRDLHENYLGNQGGEVVLVGDFDPEIVLEKFKGVFEGWTSDQPYARIDRPANSLEESRLLSIETPDKKNAMLYGSQKYDLKDTDPEYAALLLGNFILGSSGLSSRLGDRVRQQEGLSYGVGSGLTARTKDGRADFVIYAITNPSNRDKLVSVIQEELHRLRDDGVTEDELAGAKESYLQKRQLGRTQDNNLAGKLLGNLFNDRTMQFDADFETRISETTLEQVNEAIRKFIDPEKMVIVTAGDFENVGRDTP
ncbi:MAG: insulinase family protein, partial [Planctomycetota bacterium]